MTYEVNQPILNNPFEEPQQYWFIREDYEPELRSGRRPAIVYPPRDNKTEWDLGGVLRPSTPDEFAPGYEMTLVNLLRQRVKRWRDEGYPGVTRTTLDLLHHWNRPDRGQRLFFTQREAAETIIFLTEARFDLLQGINIPLDRPVDETLKAFTRYACKMATGSGKTTVMAMLTAWSVLNKVGDRQNKKFSDVVLIVCPNVTIRSRLAELSPANGEASLYRTRDLVPAHYMDKLRQGKVIITNWHTFERRQPATAGSDPAKVVKVGVPVIKRETIKISDKNTTARGQKYVDMDTYRQRKALGLYKVAEKGEKYDKQGNLKEVELESTQYLESEAAWIRRILETEIGGKGNILVLNDEAHHAYRIAPNTPDDEDDDEAKDYEQKEATIWVEGLDRIHKHRGINFCVDLSATPYFLNASSENSNKPFPWVVSDFSLMDAIESGLVKIPQLPVRDPSGKEISEIAYFNIWKWIMKQVEKVKKGKTGKMPKPELVLQHAIKPLELLGGEWEQTRQEWLETPDDPRPPVFIIVCKNTKIAKAVYEWIAEDIKPAYLPSCSLKALRNNGTETYTIRVDSKVVEELESGNTKSAESKWLRFTLDTVGQPDWAKDDQGRSLYPDDFKELAIKLGKPLHPPGRDIRCVVSVGMLTEGWDCLDQDTEVLTPYGWLGMGEIQEGDLVYSLNLETEKIDIVPVLEYGERDLKPDECMVNIKSQHLNIRVTEGHEFHIKYRNPRNDGKLSKNFLTKTAYHLYERRSAYSLPLAAELSYGNQGLNLTNDEIRFIAWFMTDGGFSNGKVVISQAKSYHHDIRSLLIRLGLDFTEKVYNHRKNTFPNQQPLYTFSIPKGTHSGGLKRNGWSIYQDYLDKDVSPLLHNLNREQFLIFWEEMLKGDGEQKDDSSGWLWCDRKSQVDAYTHMAVIRGLSASYHERITNSGKIVYRVSVRKKQWITTDPVDSRASKVMLEKPTVTEKVWCIRNQNSTLITRRGGKIVIIGNCRTVTHIMGIRPFMSQLLCEQVVGRALRRREYQLQDDSTFAEETAKIFGVPFEVIPFKANPQGGKRKPQKRHHVYAIPQKSQYRIEFPRVEGYTQSVKSRVTVDWEAIAPLKIDPHKIPPEVQMKAAVVNNQGRPSIKSPGDLTTLDLNPYRKDKRQQQLIFELAKSLTQSYCRPDNPNCEAPAHVLFPQLYQICDRYLTEKVTAIKPAEKIDVYLAPYFGWVIENLNTAIHPDTESGESPELPKLERHRDNGSTDDVNFWSSKPVYDVVKSHVNCVVADTSQWEQATAYAIDNHPITEAFVKNDHLGLSIPYFYNNSERDYYPDFIIRLNTSTTQYLILETKGYVYEGTEEKAAAAIRWVKAVNADGRFGQWQYRMFNLDQVREGLDKIQTELGI